VIVVPSSDVRKGIEDASINASGFKFMSGEILVVSAILGFSTRSWIIFGASLVILYALLFIKATAPILGILLSIGWGYIGFYFGRAWSGLTAAIILMIIAFIITIGIHIAAIDYKKDIVKADK
jgi:hypothetical protein